MTNTPTPWEAVPSPVSNCQWIIRVAGTKMHAIAMTSHGNDEANAALIVTAVNSHAALKAALDEVVSWCEDDAFQCCACGARIDADENWRSAEQHEPGCPAWRARRALAEA